MRSAFALLVFGLLGVAPAFAVKPKEPGIEQVREAHRILGEALKFGPKSQKYAEKLQQCRELLSAADTSRGEVEIYLLDGKSPVLYSDENHVESKYAFYYGKICFYGKAEDVAQMIRDGELNWDEEYLEKPVLITRGKRTVVRAKFTDGPNGVSEWVILKPCGAN